MFVFALLFSSLVDVAQAGTHVTVVVDPFVATYVPPPRDGYVWVAGAYDPYGHFAPGYWRPVAARPGYVWTGGYWIGPTYYDGYWRPASRPGYAWIDGYYVDGHHTAGRWVSAAEYAHCKDGSKAVRAGHVKAHGKGHSKHKH